MSMESPGPNMCVSHLQLSWPAPRDRVEMCMLAGKNPLVSIIKPVL